MGARVSEEMRRAQRLLWGGHTAAQASRETGITESAISKSGMCRSIIQARKDAVALLEDDATSTREELYKRMVADLCIPDIYADQLLNDRSAREGAQV